MVKIPEKTKYANLKIKFESPLIFESGKEIRFYYNASDPSNNKTIHVLFADVQ